MGDEKFGTGAGYAYTVNSVIGAGFLSVPWAFQQAGWLLSLCMQTLFLAVGWLLSNQLLEITSRVEAMKQSEEQGVPIKPISLLNILRYGLNLSPEQHSLLPCPEPALSEARQYDLSEIVKLLMGGCWSIIYLICISLFLAGTLAAYINIFGTAFGSNLPLLDYCDYRQDYISQECWYQYWIYVTIFLVLMVYFTCEEFSEQIWMQLLMTCMRIIVMSCIIITCLLSIFWRYNLTNDHEYKEASPPLQNWRTIGETFPIFLFAGIYQTQYPGILSAIRKDKAVLKTSLSLVTATLLVFYTSMGLATAFAIPDMPSNVSLAFQHYTAGQRERSDWAKGLSLLIMLFPAIDVISIFPIIGHAISDNVMSLLYGEDREGLHHRKPKIYYGLRVACILPSFLYAFLQVQFGDIVANSGLFCFYLTFFMIPLLHIAGRRLVPVPSPYDVQLNPVSLSTLISILSVPLLAFNLFTLFS